MAYTALYRTFRPIKFSDIVGQDHITKTLKNQIKAGRVGHAYLFNGGRGTGKTTSAKILARAINCLNIQDGEPCNECEICKEILAGSLTDVVEMDAASNNGVDDIRDIREEVNFLPTKAKYRVYIIDEVHMLSSGAFNALLKTLEEPPDHVKFILATTEPQKLPTTILSRCQRFDYKKISNENIISRLKIICEEANIKINEEAMSLIAILSEGAMRDAISILERCSQESVDKITAEMIKDLVGIPSLEYISKLTKAIFEKQEIEALSIIDELINAGKDIYNFLWEIIKYIKDILVYKATNKLEIYSKEELEEIENLGELVSKEGILQVIYELSKLENDIKWSSQKVIMFQTGIIKLCINNVNTSNSSVIELQNKIEQLENKLSNINSSELIQSFKNDYIPKKTEKIIEKKIEISKPEIKNNNAKDISAKVIQELKNNRKMTLYTALLCARIKQIDDLNVEIEFPTGITEYNQDILKEPYNRNDLIKAIFSVTGNEMNFILKDGRNKSSKLESTNNPLEDLGIDVKIIE